MKRGPKPKGPVGFPYYDLTAPVVPISREQADLCRRRVGGLLNWADLSTRPLADILANAYALGMADAAEILEGRKAP